MTEKEYRRILDLVIKCRDTARDVDNALNEGALDEVDTLEEKDTDALLAVKHALQAHVSKTTKEYPWAVENRVVKSPTIALFRDKTDADDYTAIYIDLRVIPNHTGE